MKIARIKPIQPRSVELTYYREIMKVVNAQNAAWLRYAGLLPDGKQRMDGIFDEAMRLFLSAVNRDMQAVLDAVPFTRIFADTSLYRWRQWRKQVETGSGYKLPTVQPFSEPGMPRLATEWVTKNVELIKGFKSQRDAQLREIIFDGVSKGLGREQLAARIEKILTASEKKRQQMEAKGDPDFVYRGIAGQTKLSVEARAELIATDQVLTASSQLDEQRMRNAHVAYYAWEGMDDGRERPAHLKLNDNIFRLDGQPMTDEDLRRVGRTSQQMRTPGAEIAPGIPVRCRCYRAPLFDGSDYDVE